MIFIIINLNCLYFSNTIQMDLEAPFSHLNPSKDYKRKKSTSSGNYKIQITDLNIILKYDS